MHDPMTVVCDVPNPLWWRRRYDGKWRPSTLATIWHVDPETDGSDDSCGYSRPKLSKRQLSSLKFLASEEAESPWFQRYYGEQHTRPADAEALIRGAFLVVGRCIRRRVTFDEASLWASEFLHNPSDNIRSALAHKPGYHTNFKQESQPEREYCATRLFCILATTILSERRRWHQHPKFHVHHWKIQFLPSQSFKRWAFSRCCVCGKGFKWGEAPVGNWNSEGPKWFRSEQNIHHVGCNAGELVSPPQSVR